MAHFGGDRVREFQRGRGVAAAEKFGFALRDEGPVDGLDEPTRGERAARVALAALARRKHGLCHRMKARQRNRLHFRKSMHAHNFFDQVGLAVDVGPP